MKLFRGLTTAAVLALILLPLVTRAQDTLPQADPPFTGRTDIDARKSIPAWPT